jgi:cytochrome P450
MSSVNIDLLDPEVRRNPFPIYRELRLRGPACQVDPGALWALTRYADVVRALRDAQTYASQSLPATFAPAWLGDDRLASFPLAMDPSQHTKMRALIDRVFSRELLSGVERPLRDFVQALTNRIDEAELDVVSELATPIAAAVMAMTLGIDPQDHRRFKHWVDMIGLLNPVEPAAATAALIRAAIDEQDAYFRAVIERRRRRPGDDVISTLLAGDLDGRPLRTEAVVAFLVLLLRAGIDTIVRLISNGLLLLSERRDLVQQLQAGKQRIPDFIEELLRYDPPTHALLRLTTGDVRLESTTIPEHSSVLLLLAAANRDPAQYDDPDQFMLDRKARKSLAFGDGPHVCVGAALARLQTRVVFEILLERFANFGRDATLAIDWDATIHTHGPKSLPMRFTRA